MQDIPNIMNKDEWAEMKNTGKSVILHKNHVHVSTYKN